MRQNKNIVRSPEYELLAALEPAAEAFNNISKIIHKLNEKWWRDPKTGRRIKRNKGEMIALMHSELSEMLEGIRKDTKDDHLPNFPSETVELADLFIRAFDYAGGHNLDLGAAFLEKLKYNLRRADHKLENRAKKGGKKF